MENPDAARFCMSCAVPLAAVQPAERRERRVVSVLFADLAGYTRRSEQLDIEDVDSVLSPYHRMLRESVERTGGVVAKLMGDGVMALFGAVAAHEDDPERALRCAMEIRDTLARETGDGRLGVRVGVTTGEALVVRSGNTAVDAVGDVVNTAARLEAAAPVDGVLVDARTFRATRRAIRFQESPAVSAKGKSTPVEVWLAVEPLSALPERGPEADVPLVGRDDELGRLAELLERSCNERSTQQVTIVGVAGIGKTRLVRELELRSAAGPEPTRWLRGRSPAYGEGIAFWALGEMIKAEAAILDSDTSAIAGERLVRTVHAKVESPQERAWVISHLRPLIGLDGETWASAQGSRVEGFAAWRRFFELLAGERPTVLVFEDLHWADAALREFVDLLGERAGAVPLMVVGTARPELLDGASGWGNGRASATLLTLSPLSEPSTTLLLGELLEEAPLPLDVQRVLLTRIEGHPLYTREYVRMLRDRRLLVRDRGGWRLTEQPEQLPESLYGVIAARLDLLADPERRLVQDAAVFGRTAWAGALSSLSGCSRSEVEQRLARLERTQLLHRADHSTLYGEIEVSFTHALVQDVAYSQISRADRAERHVRAAAWLEQREGAREDRAELLAYHYATALRLGGELGQETAVLAGHARRAHIAAGRQADAVNGYAAAARHYAAAEALMSADDPEWATVLLAHAVACYRDGAVDAAGRLSTAFEALVAGNDWWAAAEAAQLLGDWNREYSGDLDEAARWWEEAARLAELGGHWHLQVRVADGQAARLTEERRYADAVALADREIERARGADDQEGVGLLLVRGGYARVCSGQSSGLELMREGAEILSERNSRYAAWANIDLSLALMMLGDLPAALRACEQGLRWAERFGEPRLIADAESRRAFLAYHAGDWVTAREITGRYIDTAGRWSAAFVIWTHRLIAIADGDEEAAGADDEAMHRFAARVPSARALQSRRAAAAELAAGTEVQGYRNWEIYAALELMSVPEQHETIRELASRMPSDNPWRAALLAIADGRFADAAELLDGIGSQPLAAEARMIAADHGPPAEAALRASQALEFYERVGATRAAARAAALASR